MNRRIDSDAPNETAVLGGHIATQARLVGLSARDLFRVSHTEIQSILKQSKGDRRKAFSAGISRLKRSQRITVKDAARLSSLLKVLPLDADAKAAAGDDVLPKAEAIYYQLAADPATSPTALAIVSGIVGALTLDASPSTAIKASLKPTTVGTVVGAAIGGFIGGMLGPLGAAEGGFFGASIGGAIGSCFD